MFIYKIMLVILSVSMMLRSWTEVVTRTYFSLRSPCIYLARGRNWIGTLGPGQFISFDASIVLMCYWLSAWTVRWNLTCFCIFRFWKWFELNRNVAQWCLVSSDSGYPMLWCACLIVSFLCSLRFPKYVSIVRTLQNRYGTEAVQVFRKYERLKTKEIKTNNEFEVPSKCSSTR